MKQESVKPKKESKSFYQEDRDVEQTKEIAVKKAGALAMPTTTMADWGVEASSKDLVIPKLQLCQPMSKKVTEEGIASFGDIRDSLENEKFADFKTSLEFIPFFLQRKWVEYKLQQKEKSVEMEKVYVRTLPLVTNPQSPEYNDKLVYEEVVNGEMIQRDRVLDFYVLIASKIAEGGIPHVISFRRSSMKAGKALYTQCYVKNIAAGKTPASYVMSLSVTKETNEKGTYGVMNIRTGRETTPEEMAAVRQWLSVVQAGKVKVDESDLVTESSLGEAPLPF